MLFWKIERLESVRRAAEQAARGGPWQSALDRLREEAEAALAQPARSVMDKARVPPSGDRHDFYSLGPYWWPDPDKADGLPYVRRDGLINPEVEQTDRPAMDRMVNDVETLALAGFFFRDARYARWAAERLRGWFLDPATRMNPHLEYGQAIPGICEGREIGIIDTASLRRLSDAITLLHEGGALTAEDKGALLDWMSDYLRWLRTSDHGLKEEAQHNNHGTWYDAQVAALAVATGQTEVARQTVEAAPTRRIAPHILPDGSQPHELARTLSLTYSCFNLLGFFDLATLGEPLGIDLWNWRDGEGRSLRGALDFLVPYADPDRAWPYEQIVDKGRAGLLPLLRRGTLAYGGEAYEAAMRRVPGHAADRVQLVWPLTER